jgi:hypothetical protein
VRTQVILECLHQRVAVQRLLDDASLNANTAAVHQSHFAEACPVSFVDVLLDEGGDVPGSEGMEIEFGLDRDAVWLVRCQVSLPTRTPR